MGSPLSCQPWLLLGVPVQLHRTQTTRKDLLVTPSPTFHLCSQDPTDYICQSANAIPASSGQSQALRPKRGGGAGVDSGTEDEPGTDSRTLSGAVRGQGCAKGPGGAVPSTHLPAVPPATPAGSDPQSAIDAPPFSRAPLLRRGADVARARVTEAALTKQSVSLSAIDSAALGDTAGSSWEAEIKEEQKRPQTVCTPTPPRTCPGWRTIFPIFTSCLAACHRSISLLQSSNLQKYLLYII